MVNFLVTGGAGFIGSHLIEALHARGHRVRVLDDLSSGKRENLASGTELVVGDVANPATTRAAMDGVAGCFHLAAIPSVEQGVRDWCGTHRVNLGGAISVFDAARRANPDRPIPVVYASSAAVYGDGYDAPVRETDAPRPISAYAADKLGCEVHASAAAELGLPTRGLRFFNVYGPRQDPTSPYSGVISIFCERLAAGRPVTIFGDGGQTRDFVHVEDVVHALIAAMEIRPMRGEVLNVCTGRGTTVLDLASAIGNIVGIVPEIGFAAPRCSDLRSSLGDPSKARRVLDWAPTIALDQGLQRLLSGTALSARNWPESRQERAGVA